MIIGNQKKLYYKKKAWLTPKHPLYFEEERFKIHYAAAIIIEARKNPEMDLEQNFELDRLLYRGLGLNVSQIGQAMRLSADQAEVMDYFYENTLPGGKRSLLILDLYNVCERDGEISTRELESIRLFGRMLDISEEQMQLFGRFIHAAHREREAECRSIYHKLEQMNAGITLMELKYYLMTLNEIYECTQEELDAKKEIRLVDRCIIRRDIVLRKGMHMILDHAVVRIYGNIALEGGELTVENSRIIRKSGSHRACINIRHAGTVSVKNSDIDCRDQGMFIRAQDGEITIKDSEIYHTTRGAAIRFWGKRLSVSDTFFHKCYSPENGGALMLRGGTARVERCRFAQCEAVKGGAIYGREDVRVQDCEFRRCYASEHGAAVYFHGMIGDRVSGLKYQDCFPEKGQTIQYLTGKMPFDINGQCDIGISTIFAGEVDVMPQGSLRLHDAVIYIKRPIKCRGYLEMERVEIYCHEEMEAGDMVKLEHAKGCKIRECHIDGMDQHGGIFSSGTRIEIENSLFCNMRGGRAIFNALSPRITGCTFNYCQSGGVHCQGGTVEECRFVNCRGKSGAGVTMLGKKGQIASCEFIRCIADVSGGAVDRAVGNKVYNCVYRDCVAGNA